MKSTLLIKPVGSLKLGTKVLFEGVTGYIVYQNTLYSVIENDDNDLSSVRNDIEVRIWRYNK